MKLGIIARCDNTGLGYQTLELTKMLDPELVILIDSSSFKDLKQYPERYTGYNVFNNFGFLDDEVVDYITKDLDVVLSCEIFYNDNFLKIAKQNNCKTILQYNYELFPTMIDRKPEFPDVLLSPSVWNMGSVKHMLKDRAKLIHLPPPMSESRFKSNLEYNKYQNHNRILHIRGTGAAFDRNGTESLISAMKGSREDFELVIKTQAEFDKDISDSRITIDVSDVENSEDLYYGFDAMFLPRRYGGLCLPMNEALLSGLPVFMTSVEPNNKILPREWLLRLSGLTQVETKVRVNAYKPDITSMSAMIDRFIKSTNKKEAKSLAYDIGYKNFSPHVLKDQYLDLFNSL